MHLNYTILYNALPVLIFLIIIESVFLMKEKREDKKNFISSILMAFLNVPFSTLTNITGLYLYTIIYHFRFFTISTHSWIAWIGLVFGDELAYYWFHRMSHQIRILWAPHKVHHSSQKYTFTSGLRVPWTGGLTGSFLFWAWLPLFGFLPAMVLFMKSLAALYQFWLHTETIHKMPAWFEAIFNTPSHHRVHHSSDIIYLDKNYGGTMILYDKIFGTYQEEIFKPKYGLTSDINSANAVSIEIDEWKHLFRDLKKSKNGKDRLRYLFDSPGWSTDEDYETTKKLQRNLKENEVYTAVSKTKDLSTTKNIVYEDFYKEQKKH